MDIDTLDILENSKFSDKTINTIGYVGAVLLDITLLPQLYKTFKSKQTRDISIYFMFLQIITCIFFLIYGILLNEVPIMMANSILMCELLLLLYAKIIYSYCRTEQSITSNNVIENSKSVDIVRQVKLTMV